ncbi:hypothetical protein [Paracoccus jeotgali]|nr:hypothetical protein [Paracoccus jeotgali]
MKILTTIGAGAAVAFTLVACAPTEETPITRAEADLMVEETVAPAAPVAASGAVAPANSVNGSYNLRASECGQPGSEGALNIQGNKFVFHESECTAISSTNKGDATEVELSCTGENQGFTRLTKLRLSPGVLRLEENNVGLRYYRCPAAT